MSKKTIILVILFIIGLFCCLFGAIALIGVAISSNPGNSPVSAPTGAQPNQKKYEAITAAAGYQEVDALAKSISPAASLVTVADDQGESALYFTIGKDDRPEDLTKDTLDGVVKKWLYVYVTDPAQITPEAGNSFFGKYNVKEDQGFIISFDSVNGAQKNKSELYGDSRFHNLTDLGEALKKTDSRKTYDIAYKKSEAEIISKGLADKEPKSVEMRLVNIGQISFTGGESNAFKPYWKVSISFDNTDTEQEYDSYTFNADVTIDGVVE